MKGFKFKPVAWMSTILGILVALMALDDALKEAGAGDLVPTRWEPYVLGAIAILTAVLGKLAHDRVTPLADPKAANGRALVPTPPATVPPGTPQQYLRADDGTD